jgi:hypothetical protein
MAAELGDELHRRWGLRSFTPEQGAEVLPRLLGSTRATVGVARVDWEQFWRNLQGRAVTQLVRPLTEVAPAQAPVSARNDVATELRRAQPEARRPLLMAFLAKGVNIMLGQDENAPVPTAGRVNEAGIDSILSIDLLRYIQHTLGMSLPSTLLFTHPGFEDLATYLEEQLAQEVKL